MPVKVVENKGTSVMFVGGKMIFPGSAELVDVPEDAEPEVVLGAEEGDEDADYDAPLIAMLRQRVSNILPDLPALTDDALIRLEELERAGQVRKGLLAELTAERLKRAASSGGEEQGGGDKNREEQAGEEQGGGDKNREEQAGEEQGQGSAEATQPGAEQGAGAGEGGAA